MINLTSLLLYLLTSVCGASAAQDVCREVVIKKAADCDVKTLCCRAAPPGACCQAIIKTAGGDDVKRACCGAATPDFWRQLIVTSAADSGVKPIYGATALALLGPDDQEKKIVLRKLKEAPKVWIGVRVSPVPESLASHLKRGGLMVANVAEDSPADRAGVERYDVAVSFAGKAIEEMDDLIQAIQDTGTDNAAEMVVIRGGKEKTLTITPTKGGDAGAWVMKYEEPEQPEVDQLKEYFGGRLKVGPDDVRIYMPYGRLNRLPEDIEKMLEDMPDIDREEWSEDWEEWSQTWREWSEKLKKFKHGPFDVRIDIDADDWAGRSGDEGDVKAEIHIRVKKDGETIRIERAEDGTITIEREDPDGARSSETYENLDQLRKENPEAYKTYRRFLVLRSPQAFIVPPDLEDLGVHQHDFQIELEQQLDRARQQVEEATERVRKARKHVEIRKKGIAGEGMTKSVMIFMEDGRITLEITEDGVSRKYEFDSREDFQKTEPELYEQCKKYLDEADARSDRIKPASASLIA